MGAAGMVPRIFRNGRQPGKQRFVCGAPPQTSLLTLIGEVETTGLTRLLRPLAREAPGHTSQAPRPHGQGWRRRHGRRPTG